MDRSLSRNVTLDIARGILIILVVLGHSIHLNYGFGTYADKLIYSFHMPAFFVISGYLVYDSLNNREVVWAMRKTIQRLIPIIVFGCLLYVLSYYSYLNGGYLDVSRLAQENSFFGYWWKVMIINGMGNDLWFFWTLIWCGIIISVAHLISRKYKFDKKYEICVYLFICVVVCCIKITSWYSFGVEDIQWCLPFFLGGYLISMNSKYLSKYSTLILITMSIIFIILCRLRNFGVGFENVSIWLWNLSFVDSFCKVLAAVCGTAFIVLLARILSRVFCVRKSLEYFGKNRWQFM